MTGTSLTDQLMTQLQGAPLQQLARQVGLDPAQAGTAVNAALPLLLGALGRNAASSEGAGALQRDHAGLDIGSVLGSVLGGGSAPSASSAGAAVANNGSRASSRGAVRRDFIVVVSGGRAKRRRTAVRAGRGCSNQAPYAGANRIRFQGTLSA